MGPARVDAATGDRRAPDRLLLLVGLAVGLLPALLPLLVQGPAPVVAALALAAALATLLVLEHRLGHLAPRPTGVAPATAYDDWAAGRGVAHDPVHHPRRPRAPGTV